MPRKSTLDPLTEDQKAQLYDWLLEMPAEKVLERIARPAPDGFGIKTHLTTLRRFKNRRDAENAADILDSAAHLGNIAPGREKAPDETILTELRRHLCERASSPAATDSQVALLASWVNRQQRLTVAIQHVQIARKRLAQNNRRLDLTERAVKVKEKQAEQQTPGNQPRKEDALGPLIRKPEDILARAIRKFRSPNSSESHGSSSETASPLQRNESETPSDPQPENPQP